MERLGPYRVVAMLGEGGMGEVYRAIDERLGRTVAIKLLHAGDAASAQMQLRLLREAQAASALDHPGVVTVFDVGVHEHSTYVVMELVTGERFSDLAGKLAPEDALRLCAAAADALAAAHDAGILHRDIKSDNLMRTKDGRVKVLDFGLAKLQDGGAAAQATSHPAVTAISIDTSLDATLLPDDPTISSEMAMTLPATASTPGPALTQIGALIGTPLYMSPEQADREPVTPRSEVWSLGVVLYELLTGTVPFHGDDVAGTLDLVRKAAYVPPSQRRPSLPHRFDPIVAKALARSPDARYADMRDFAFAMRRAAGDVVERRPWAWIAIGGGAAAAAAITAVVLTRDDGAAPPAIDAAPPRIQPQLTFRDEPRRLTAQEGCEEFPSFADGGKTVIYDGARRTDYVLHAIDVATGNIRQLTDVAGWDYASSISPDGKQLAFIRSHDQGVGVWVMGYDPPTPPRHVIDGSLKPVWTADGKLWAGGVREYQLVDLATGKVERSLVPDDGQRFSMLAPLPGGRHATILVQANAQVFLGVALYEPDGAHELIFPQTVDEVLTPVRGGVLTARMHNETSTLWYVPTDREGGEPAAIDADIEARKGLAISPQGDLVWSNCHVKVEVAALEVRAGQTELRKLSGGTWTDQSPQTIPGTRSIVMLSDRGGPDGLWIIHPDGSAAPRELDTGDLAPNDPAPSPDGKWIAFSTPAVGIHVVPIDGSAPPRAVTTGGTDVVPAWSGDGREIYFQTGEPGEVEIRAVSVDGGASRAVIDHGTVPDLSRDGRWLVYLDHTRTPTLHDLRTGKDRPLSKQLGKAPYDRVRFHPEGKRVALSYASNSLVEVDLATGKVLARHDAGGDQLTGLTYLDDRIITTRAMWEGDLWIARGDLVLPE